MKQKIVVAVALALISATTWAKKEVDLWPDGTEVADWFHDASKVDPETLGKKYVVTDYGVSLDSTIVQTKELQAVIDRAAQEGGGLIVIPKGTFLSGSLFFKQGTHLYLSEGGTLKGSDRIRNFKIVKTRMEGQTLNYFAALVNADSIKGFTICGPGTINGNGLNYWEEFWIRRQYNRQCTNLEAMRPRLVYISHCQDVTVQDVNLVNSPFWTNHLYRSERVRFLDCYIYAPTSGIKAPSSDAIDIDVCKDILVKGCYMSVNDDAVVIKGGKGTWADKDPDNGPVSNVIVEDCTYGRVHGCLTLGSESIEDHNIVLRRCHVEDANRVLWLKMRPDTPQHYEYVTVEQVEGQCSSFLVVRPWTQFFKPEEREDMPLSTCSNITLRDIKVKSKNFFDVGTSDKYQLKDFTFENLDIEDEKQAFDPSLINGTTVRNVVINGQKK